MAFGRGATAEIPARSMNTAQGVEDVLEPFARGGHAREGYLCGLQQPASSDQSLNACRLLAHELRRAQHLPIEANALEPVVQSE